MLLDLPDFAELLRAPGAPDRAVEMVFVSGQLHQARAGEKLFPIVGGQPVLVDFDRSILDRRSFTPMQRASSPVPRRGNSIRALKAQLLGSARISRRNFDRFADLVRSDQNEPRRILMIGAASQGIGADELYSDDSLGLIAFDIYPSSLTQLVADAHAVPLADSCVDGVVIQAVLEHVLDPQRVVEEIVRVLKPGGFVYAETPFMQQVHEGAYDFSRFTESGHRWLFRRFESMARGAIGGPGLTMFWAARTFLQSLCRSRRIGSALSLPFALLALVDRFLPEDHLIDGANGVYFLGRKSEQALEPREIVAQYLGRQG